MICVYLDVPWSLAKGLGTAEGSTETTMLYSGKACTRYKLNIWLMNTEYALILIIPNTVTVCN